MRATLEALLASLGYDKGQQGWAHGEGRQLVFVGDLLDRGPDPLGCLELVEELVSAGVAQAVLGNHEVNAAHFMLGHRERSEKNLKQLRTTLAQTEVDPARWDRAFAFIERTPTRLLLDDGKLRVIHACWSEEFLADLPELINTPELWKETAKGGRHYEAVEVCLKGPERPVVGDPLPDKDGVLRDKKRVDWWKSYHEDLPLVVFGHYWFPWNDDLPVLGLLGPGRNAVCVDHSAGKGGWLVALRYPEIHFVAVPNRDSAT